MIVAGSLAVALVFVGGALTARRTSRALNQSATSPAALPTASSTAGVAASSSDRPPCATATATNCDKSRLSASTGSLGTSGCKGKGTATITASPIAFDDLLYIQPMGLMIGGHVTPIDHGYFYVKDATSQPPRKSAVYSPIDGTITAMHREHRGGSSGAIAYDDYSLTIDASCTFRIRFSNMTGFGGALGDQVGQLDAGQTATPNYSVKAGELIGYTGGDKVIQGIDVWVENDDVTLTGFVNPKQYVDAESWKLHMVDFFDYTQEPLKSQLLALTMRDASPRFGKIDWDIDGKLIGSWFKTGSGGYGGIQQGGEGYWAGHLSIVPDGNDPTQTIVSLGDYQGQARQFAVIGNQPDPAAVDQSTGLIKYELGQIEYYSGDTGQRWDHQSFLPHIRTRADGSVRGTILLQLIDKRVLKMEIFSGKTAAQVSGFDANALTYER